MFDYIKGTLIAKCDNKIIVENNGIGYSFLCTNRVMNVLDEIGQDVKIYTKLVHKEDSMYFCGFLNNEDKIIFDILTTVSGVGVKVALSLLDEFKTSELIDFVVSDDYKAISRAKGIGPKMAQKIILELKDKLKSAKTTLKFISVNTDSNIQISSDNIIEVQTMLQNLGWSPNEYKSAIEEAVNKIKSDNIEDILRESLKILSK